MLILIAESKTMLEQEQPVSRECYKANTPAGEAFADETMARIADIIKPYRFDFTTPLAPDDKTFAAYWKKDVTIQLVKYLKATGEKNILNLLPADAAKCIDWKLVKNFAKVWKVDFKEQDGTAVRTPHAGKLKALRGHLLRQIITQDITTPTPLLTLESDLLLPLGTPDYPDHTAFAV